MKLRHNILIIFIATLVYSSSYSAQFSYDRLMENNIDHISNIYTCGRWKSNKTEGFYRIIYVNFLYGCSWLYVQWMQDYNQNGETKAVNTLEVYTNDHHENTFDLPKCKENKDGIKLNYIEDNGHNGIKYNVELKIYHEFGKHSINRKQK